MQSFVDFGTRTVWEDYSFNHPLDTFFNFSFFCPQPKAEADSFICVSFLVVYHLFVLMLRCDYIRSFLSYKFVFFAFPQIRHSGFGRFYQSSDALVGGIVGIRLTPSSVIIFFFGNSFFFYDATKNNQSFSFGCQRGRISKYLNSSYLINDCDNICEFLLVKYNKMKNTQSIE